MKKYLVVCLVVLGTLAVGTAWAGGQAAGGVKAGTVQKVKAVTSKPGTATDVKRQTLPHKEYCPHGTHC